MFPQNRRDRLIERPKTRYMYPRIPFQEYEINQFQRMVLYFPSFIETCSRCLWSYAVNAHLVLLFEYLQNEFQCQKNCVVYVGYILGSFKAPRNLIYCTINSLIFVLLCAI